MAQAAAMIFMVATVELTLTEAQAEALAAEAYQDWRDSLYLTAQVIII